MKKNWILFTLFPLFFFPFSPLLNSETKVSKILHWDQKQGKETHFQPWLKPTGSTWSGPVGFIAGRELTLLDWPQKSILIFNWDGTLQKRIPLRLPDNWIPGTGLSLSRGNLVFFREGTGEIAIFFKNSGLKKFKNLPDFPISHLEVNHQGDVFALNVEKRIVKGFDPKGTPLGEWEIYNSGPFFPVEKDLFFPLANPDGGMVLGSLERGVLYPLSKSYGKGGVKIFLNQEETLFLVSEDLKGEYLNTVFFTPFGEKSPGVNLPLNGEEYIFYQNPAGEIFYSHYRFNERERTIKFAVNSLTPHFGPRDSEY